MTDIQAALGSADGRAKDIGRAEGLAASYDRFEDPTGRNQPNCCLLSDTKAILLVPRAFQECGLTGQKGNQNHQRSTQSVDGIATTGYQHPTSYARRAYAQFLPTEIWTPSGRLSQGLAANDCSISLPLFHGMTEEQNEVILASPIQMID